MQATISDCASGRGREEQVLFERKDADSVKGSPFLAGSKDGLGEGSVGGNVNVAQTSRWLSQVI
jgi:hypothetical protein